ncbi:putative antitoxin of wHTH fold [Halanaeroarchaeum sp. HSR-CO]|uniref:DUF433 domain-containing protein n=1 Tax=Halanaeroarchaeum sp. HSR-CO TaxID=2866382 RepID=UPI00217D7531|nr:DUF433 domain-containing protein [Halanaeroarchaeum sp. HSR-CO]UWG47437.1 putative antitoxin of wHTH fold [Halanaeroarchaeum sp. HSR-CO]
MTIVQDEKMAGEPRIEGRRITVFHVVTAVEDFGGVGEAAEQLRITEEEIEEALQYANEHSDEG